MNKKVILAILVIIIIAALTLSFIHDFRPFNNEKSIEIGDLNYILPSDYNITSSDRNVSANITNGTNTIQLSVLNGNNVTKFFLDYKSEKESQNNNVSLTKFNINDFFIYRSVIVHNESFIHYWFAYNDQVYSISTWDGNNNTDDIISNLIKTAKLPN